MAVIRQEINILDGVLTSTGTAGTTSSAKIYVDTTKYNGATYYFEVVAKNSGGQARNVLYGGDSGAGSQITIPTTATSYTRFRSAAFTPVSSDNNGGHVTIVSGGVSTSIQVKCARVIVIQNADNILETQTQIEVGNQETGLTNTGVAPLANPKYWTYNAANYDGDVTFYAEVTYRGSSASRTYTYALQQDNGSYTNWTTAVTIVNAGTATSATRVRSIAFTPVDGRHYRITSASSSNMATHDIFNGKIIIDQAGISTTVECSDDTYYGTSFFPGPNGTATTLQFGGWADQYYDYFLFDLDTAPDAADVTAATLNIYVDSPSVNDPVAHVRRVTSAWSGTTLTRTNTPTEDATNFGNFPTLGGGSPRWVSVDITTLAVGWLDGTYSNFGLKVQPTVTGDRNNGSFQSRENASGNVPYIEFTTTGVTTTSITKIETQYLFLNTADAGTGLQTVYQQWNAGEWSGVTNTYYYSQDAKNASDSSKLVDTTTSTDISGATVTGANQQTSALFLMPATGDSLDTNVTNSTGIVCATRVLVVCVVNPSTQSYGTFFTLFYP